VDFMNRRIKRSFGTALKLVDTRYAYSSSLIIVLSIGLFYISPSAKNFTDTIMSAETYQLIGSRLLPPDFPFLQQPTPY